MRQTAQELIVRAESMCAGVFADFERVEQSCTHKVLDAFHDQKIATGHFVPTTGYGYTDPGRDALERVFAQVMGCQDALVRAHIASGTHAIAICLFGLLRPGDELLCVSGTPYDTIHATIGQNGQRGDGSLRDFGVSYREIPLSTDDRLDSEHILRAISHNTRVVYIQRSRGYAWRESLSPENISTLYDLVKAAHPNTFVVVDNCYGEFVCETEPRADILVGSLIKNPGGGIAPTGGYIAGTKAAIKRIEGRLTAPGIGREVGSYALGYQSLFQGLFMAPHTVCQALKTAALSAAAFELLGSKTFPKYSDERWDIIQAVELSDAQSLVRFCHAVQESAPIDAHAVPEPAEMPGYDHLIIMAAGTFVAGASIEWSADAPLKEPFIAYVQGALTYAHGKYGVTRVIERLKDLRLGE